MLTVAKINVNQSMIRHWSIRISIFLFISSLYFKAFYVRDAFPNDEPIAGWLACAVGPLIFLYGPIQTSICWLANICIFIAWIGSSMESRKTAIFFSLSAVLLAGSFFFAEGYYDPEGGGITAITHVGAGYWLWLSSAATATIAAFSEEQTGLIHN